MKKGNRIYVVKLHIEVKEEYLDTKGIEDAIRENIMYPPLLPDCIVEKKIVSWWRYYKGLKQKIKDGKGVRNEGNSISK